MNLFAGRSIHWLQAELEKAQADLAAGKTLSAWNAEGAGGVKMVQATPQERIEQLLAALHRLDPEAYPAADVRRLSRTRGVFLP
jgi:hypothetical protein